MGGTTFGFEGKRLNREQFFGLWKETIEPGLTQLVKEGVIKEYYLIQGFKDKTDFGDMDVLIKGTLTPAVVMDIFEVELTKSNGKVVSFMYDGFQIDLIRISREAHWESAVAYYSHGDLGMLVGKIARTLRLRWGWKGLVYPVYNNIITRTRRIGEITITTNPEHALAFLGFKNTGKLVRGFQKEEDMFRWVVESDFFTREAFRSERLNAKQRQRDAKRPSYQRFLRFLESLDGIPNTPRPSDTETLKRADEFFGKHFTSDVLEMLLADQRFEAARQRFNGRHVMEQFDVQGEELGRIMKMWNDQFEDAEERTEYILKRSRDVLLEEVARFVIPTGGGTNK